MLREMKRLGDGIDDGELARCQARARSSLIMQQESTGARASSIARDWFHLRRVNTLTDIQAAVNALSVSQIMDYVRRYPARNFTVLAIGPEPLSLVGD